MDNAVLFSSGAVEISRSIARFGDTSYPIANIGSVSVAQTGKSPLKTFGAFLVLIGLLLYFSKGLPLAVVIGGIGLAIIWYASQEVTVVLKTSSGDVQALRTRDKSLASQVKSAIEQAFTMR